MIEPTPLSDGPLLMTPGPTRVPRRVLAAGARPMIHHRSEEFSEALAAVVEGLRPILGTAGDVLPLPSTGRGGLLAAICNCFSPGERILACCNGKFGEMWARFAEEMGLAVTRVCADWTREIDPAEVEAAFDAHPEAKAIVFPYSESTTGACADAGALCRIARDRGALAMIDAISAAGGAPVLFDAWDADVIVTASQKCLMSSPGLAFVAVGDRAWRAAERATLPKSYWNFFHVRDALAESPPQPAGTAPVTVTLQVREALAMIHEEGLENVIARHAAMARRTREWMTGRGLAMQCPGFSRYSPTLTGIAAPEGIDPGDLRRATLRRGVRVAGGLDRFQSDSFRIGHMGDIRMPDLETTLAALDEALDELRAPPAARPA